MIACIFLFTIFFTPALTYSLENTSVSGEKSLSQKITAQELRKRLHKHLKKTHKKVFNYKQVWDALKYTDEDPNNPNNVILLYSLRSTPKANQYQGGKGPDKWNREHVWAKSHGFPKKSQWAYTDLHHLRPADKTINSSRNDLDFGEGGSKHKECDCRRKTLTRTTGTWEPPDQVKGDIARMLFYMDVRYEGTDANTEDLKLVDNITDSGQPNIGRLCTLLKWHQQDPPDSWEKRRNNRIEELQGNRNPFIGQPELAVTLWGDSCN